MDIATHSITLIAIIVGLGLTEMFGNLHRLIRNRKRVIWDWLPVFWAMTLLTLVINYWWALYLGISGLERVSNAAEFGLLLATPILLFLTTASVLPHFDEANEWDMRRHYDEQRRTFIITFALYQCSTTMIGFIAGTFGSNFVTVFRAVILLLLVLMLLINRRQWDWAGVLVIFAALIFRLTTQMVR